VVIPGCTRALLNIDYNYCVLIIIIRIDKIRGEEVK
jgi:hypothetical protein